MNSLLSEGVFWGSFELEIIKELFGLIEKPPTQDSRHEAHQSKSGTRHRINQHYFYK
jgi:hypothetical protein